MPVTVASAADTAAQPRVDHVDHRQRRASASAAIARAITSAPCAGLRLAKTSKPLMSSCSQDRPRGIDAAAGRGNAAFNY